MSKIESKSWFFTFLNHFFIGILIFGKSNRWGISHNLRLWFVQILSHRTPGFILFLVCNLEKCPKSSQNHDFYTFLTIFCIGIIFFGKSNRWGISHNLRLWFVQILSHRTPGFILFLVCNLEKCPKSSQNHDFSPFWTIFLSAFFFSAKLIEEAYHTICAFGLYKF